MRPLCQMLQRRGFNGDGRHPTRYYPSVPTVLVIPSVTSPCRDARLVSSGKASIVSNVTASSLCQRLQRRGFNGDGRTTVRPYISLLVTAPLHIVTRLRKVVSEGIGKLRQVVVALACGLEG